MADDDLDNPFWCSLRTRHRMLARSAGEVARYPREYAPFLGVAHAGVDVSRVLPELLAADETVYLLGVAPAAPEGWALEALEPLAQMACGSPVPAPGGPPPVALDARHRDDVLALTALVYPHYFRPCTMELGRYFGIYQDGRLAAMVGERLGTDSTQEISAVCTHPDFNGRGYARRLLAFLGNDTHARGRLPFLHVSQDNHRAIRLYRRNGYRLRREIPFWSLRRARACGDAGGG